MKECEGEFLTALTLHQKGLDDPFSFVETHPAFLFLLVTDLISNPL